MLKLKVCGMKYPQNIVEAASLEPDYMGFIFYEKSPRNFEGSLPQISSNIKKTGVFVDTPLETIIKRIKEHHFQAVQLHGGESPAFCEALKAEGVEVLKAFPIKNVLDLKQMKSYENTIDFFLFDTFGKARGGNGKTFNWELLKDYSLETPFFLSGGISLLEIEDLKQLYTYFIRSGKQHLFYGIDVNSKFESKAGLKKIDELKELKTKLRNHVI